MTNLTKSFSLARKNLSQNIPNIATMYFEIRLVRESSELAEARQRDYETVQLQSMRNFRCERLVHGNVSQMEADAARRRTCLIERIGGGYLFFCVYLDASATIARIRKGCFGTLARHSKMRIKWLSEYWSYF